MLDLTVIEIQKSREFHMNCGRLPYIQSSPLIKWRLGCCDSIDKRLGNLRSMFLAIVSYVKVHSAGGYICTVHPELGI
jgi:hypothetical protein